MKRVLITIVIVVLGIVLLFLIAAPFVNDNVARDMADKLAGLPLPDHTEYIESVYQAGKLVGNGNGMQYFGAILIKSELSLEELREYYASHTEKEWECMVDNQVDTDIKVIEHTQLEFKTKAEENRYYIVYSWGYHHTVFHELDLRGH